LKVKPPRAVKVGPFKYGVHGLSQLHSITGDAGGVDHIKQEIIYHPEQADEQERDTILHELLHCLIFQTHLRKKFEEAEEEELVWTLSPRLLALLRDNPRLVQYLTEKE
jgi:hypothetical protein